MVIHIFRFSCMAKVCSYLCSLAGSFTNKIQDFGAQASSLFSQDSFHALSSSISSQTLHRRRGARFIVRADAVSLNTDFCVCFMGLNEMNDN